LAVPNALRKRIERVARNEFARNVITMFSGNAIAYTITLASIPILSRIYTPQEFGLVALMVSIINVVSVAASGRYDMAIVLPKRSGQAFHLLVASLCIVLVVSILSIAGIWTFRDSVNGYFAEDSYRRIIWLIPLGVFLAGAQKCLYYWFNRNKEYKVLSYNRFGRTQPRWGCAYRGAYLPMATGGFRLVTLPGFLPDSLPYPSDYSVRSPGDSGTSRYERRFNPRRNIGISRYTFFRWAF
jgi:O-antigen/teichoic acid export membrane protein